MKTQLPILFAALFSIAAAATPPATTPAPAILLGGSAQTGRWGDQGDGTFRNPILAGDYSDPDPIRVGEDYYMVTSTFAGSPGVTVLHSRDLVNWKHIGAAIPDVSVLGPNFNWDKMSRYGVGVYAPSIRYHAGKFWVFVNCVSGEGFYVCTAQNPAGPWTVTQMKDKNGRPLRTQSWTDPCPFWDDDGKAYLASSRPGPKWYSYLFEMTPDGTKLLDADVEHMNQKDIIYSYPLGGTRFHPYASSEGNKIYKRNGIYYLVHIEFLDSGMGKGTYVLRSKNLYGTKPDGTPGRPGDPGIYDIYKIGPVHPKPIGQELPGQGGFVDTPDGRWFWLAQFNRTVADGRTPHLLPVTWIDDWPVIGVDIKDKQGKFAWSLPKPIQGAPIEFPYGGDTFDSPELNVRWQWNHQPRAEKWSLTERPGFLRLHSFRPLSAERFHSVGNVLNQRHFKSEIARAEVKLELAGMIDGQEAGLVRFNGGRDNARIGIVREAGVLRLRHTENKVTTPGPELPKDVVSITLRTTALENDTATFDYSFDGKTYESLGGVYKLTSAGYRGDMVGIYTFNREAEGGYVDVDAFDYRSWNAPNSIHGPQPQAEEQKSAGNP
jgi:beta-xylosidase